MAEYYIATTGSDSNNGSIGSPWLTWGHALPLLVAGDILSARAGSHPGINFNEIVLPSGASWANPITIRAYPTEIVSLGAIGGNCDTTHGQYLIFQDFLIPSGTLSVTNFSGPGPSAAGDSYIRFLNIEVTNWHPDTNGISILGNHVEVINCYIHDQSTSFVGEGHGIYFAGDFNLFDNLHIHNTHRYAIHFFASGLTDVINFNTVKNCRLHDNPWGNLLVSKGEGNVVYNNLIYDSEGNGIEAAYGAIDTVIANNTIYSNAGVGIKIGGFSPDTENTLIINNIVYGNTGDFDNSEGVNTTFATNLTTDPSFVNPGAGDFHISSGSAARNAGTTVSLVTTDYDGTSRPQGGTYDIGAFEFIEEGPSGTFAHDGTPVGNGIPGPATSVAASATGVDVGSLVAVWVRHAGAPTTITVTDSLSTLTPATKVNHANGDLSGQWHYILSSAASGSETYTATLGAARAGPSIIVFRATYTGTAVLDVQALSATNATGGTNPASPDFTTTGTDEIVFGGYAEYVGQIASDGKVNDLDATASLYSPGSNDTAAWGRIFANTFTDNVNVTVTASDWICNAIAFKTIATGEPITLTPSPLAISMATPSPSLTLVRSVTTSPVTMPLLTPAPTLGFVGSSIAPAPVAMPLTLPANSLSLSALLVEPIPVPMTLPAPSLGFVMSVSATPVAMPLLTPAPTLSFVGAITPTPTALPLILPAPTMEIDYTLSPAALSSIAFVTTPVLLFGALTLTPQALAMPIAFPAPLLVGGAPGSGVSKSLLLSVLDARITIVKG